MTREESLEFLQSCLDHIESLTKEEAMEFVSSMEDTQNNTTSSKTDFEIIFSASNDYETESYTDNKFFYTSDIISNDDFYNNLNKECSNTFSKNIGIAA